MRWVGRRKKESEQRRVPLPVPEGGGEAGEGRGERNGRRAGELLLFVCGVGGMGGKDRQGCAKKMKWRLIVAKTSACSFRPSSAPSVCQSRAAAAAGRQGSRPLIGWAVGGDATRDGSGKCARRDMEAQTSALVDAMNLAPYNAHFWKLPDLGVESHGRETSRCRVVRSAREIAGLQRCVQRAGDRAESWAVLGEQQRGRARGTVQ